MTGKEGGSPSEKSTFGRGFVWEGDDPTELAAVIDAAFDYRGDVSLRLAAGEEVAGYIANREARGLEPHLDLFPSDGSPRRRILYSAVASVSFSGKDTASGKSWETWVRRWNAKKEAESCGESPEAIGLYPETLE